jgi:hypothetical protein
MKRNIAIAAAAALCSFAPMVADSAAGAVGVGIDRWTSAYRAAKAPINAADSGLLAADTAKEAGGEKGPVDAALLDDNELMLATLTVDSVKVIGDARRLILIRRDYEYKRQTRAALAMMIFIAVAMATAQSWNPR